METIKELIEQFQFTDGTWTILLPIILMGVDVMTGLTNAWVKGEVKSSILRAGLGKKMGEMAILFIGEMFLFGMKLPVAILDGISLYLILMELISICENLDKLGVPIPKFVLKALATTDKNIQGKDDKEDKTE